MSKHLPFELTKNEYLISELTRSKLPYLVIWGIGLSIAITFFVTFLQMWSGEASFFGSWFGISIENGLDVAPIFIFLSAVSLLFALIGHFVYSHNRMFITNEHIIRIKQYGIVATDKKAITHLNIEDVKARKNFLGNIFNYGKVTLSTEGQNATYEINYIKDPYDFVSLITDTRDEYQQSIIDKGGSAIPVIDKR